MESTLATKSRASVHVENVGGIVETDVELRPGVNVLTGRNATNRTSFLRALMAGLGSDDVALRGDADEGLVELAIGEETYTRQLRRAGGIVTTGEPYLEDPTAADLFAFLLESNGARRAVAAGGDLREVVMRPVDTDAIEEEIAGLEREKREIESQIGEHADLEDRLAELDARREEIDEEIEETREELAETEAEIEDADADLEETREEKKELDEKLAELQDRRSDREEVRFRIESQRETLERLEEERSRVEERIEEAAESPGDELEALSERISELRERKRDLETTVNQLQGIIQFNQEMLSGEGVVDLEAVVSGGGGSDRAVTEQLLPGTESLVCWTCGTETDREEIEETLDALREHHRGLIDRRRSVVEELEGTVDRQNELRAARERRSDLESERRRLDEEIGETEGAIERLTDRIDEIDDEIDGLEDEVEDLREEDLATIVDLHSRANELEFEIERLESERDRVDSRYSSTEERIDELSELEERRGDVRDELEAARTRIERLEDDAVDSFNDHMEEVLSVLEYENVDRIWLERKRAEGRSRGRAGGGSFDLHVVRTTDDGTAYEDTVAHLSESEREVTGLVFALAGYLVHEVYEEVPFVLLDSLEAIDAGRIAELIEYFADYAPYLVVALLPGDAEAVDDRHHRVESI